MSAVITLTTDFGVRDPYVAEMKAVILRLNPSIHLVDVTHDVAAHDVVEGGLALETMASVCPEETVHVGVVDPGVGTGRRGLVVVSAGQFFVGPDNGIFTPLLARGAWRAFELRAPEYRGRVVSATFHGRDVFAPAAAHLTLGVGPERFGPSVTDPVRVPWPEAREIGAAVDGRVIHVDRFGNLITSIDAGAVERLVGDGGALTVSIGGRRVPLVRTYGDLAAGGVGALLGSRGRLEVAVRQGSAAQRLGVRRGARVRVSRSTRTSRASGTSRTPGRRRS